MTICNECQYNDKCSTTCAAYKRLVEIKELRIIDELNEASSIIDVQVHDLKGLLGDVN